MSLVRHQRNTENNEEMFAAHKKDTSLRNTNFYADTWMMIWEGPALKDEPKGPHQNTPPGTEPTSEKSQSNK